MIPGTRPFFVRLQGVYQHCTRRSESKLKLDEPVPFCPSSDSDSGDGGIVGGCGGLAEDETSGGTTKPGCDSISAIRSSRMLEDVRSNSREIELGGHLGRTCVLLAFERCVPIPRANPYVPHINTSIQGQDDSQKVLSDL